MEGGGHIYFSVFSGGLVAFCRKIEEPTLPNPLTVYLTLFIQECDDVSDEKNCKIVSIDPVKYLKSKPPPSIKENSKLPISLR